MKIIDGKQVPEVGDVWVNIITNRKTYIIFTNLNAAQLFDGDRCFMITKKILFHDYKYLGKSKANINQLFEVLDDN